MFVAANKGSYVANAGKSRHLTDAFKYTNAFSYNPIDTVKSGMKADAAKYISKTKYGAQKDYNAKTGKTELDGLSKYNRAAEEAQGKQRMAGLLGMLGGTAYFGTQLYKNNTEKEEEPIKRETVDISDQLLALNNYQSTYEGIKQKLKELQTEYGTSPPLSSNSDTSEPSSSNSGTSQPSAKEVKPVAFAGGGAGWAPLGSTIKLAEGTFNKGDRAYNTGYGDNMFENLDKHPDTVWHTKKGSSAAAGAYQFMPGTWQTVVQPKLNLPDFSPESQEKAGEFLANNRGVKTDKIFTTRAELASAFNKLSGTWAGLPNKKGVSAYEGYNGNSAMSKTVLENHYEKMVRKIPGYENFTLE